MKLDKRDLQLLAILQEEGRTTKSELAARIGLSHASIAAPSRAGLPGTSRRRPATARRARKRKPRRRKAAGLALAQLGGVVVFLDVFTAVFDKCSNRFCTHKLGKLWGRLNLVWAGGGATI